MNIAFPNVFCHEFKLKHNRMYVSIRRHVTEKMLSFLSIPGFSYQKSTILTKPVWGSLNSLIDLQKYNNCVTCITVLV